MKKDNVSLRTGPQTGAAPLAPSLRGLPSAHTGLGECPIVKQKRLHPDYNTPSTASRSPSFMEGGRHQISTFITMAVVIVLLLSCVVPVFAAEGNVTYSGDAGKFIFAPGSAYSPADLFPNFKDVMPGDSIVQPITVKNDASNKVKVKIYMRSLGAHADSEEFLSRLRLRVEKSEDNTMAYMFDAAASETAQLTDWVCLGTLYSGGEVNLNVSLDVPVELDNAYQKQIGCLDWEFMIQEYEIDPDDPEPPKTGDDARIFLWTGLMLVSLCAMLLLLFTWKRKEKDEK